MKNKQGFTLIEVVVVVVIIGILAAVAIPYYNKVVERSRMSDIEQLMGRVVQDQQAIKLRTGQMYSENWNALMSTPTGMVKGKIWCSKTQGIDFQGQCPDGHNGFKVELFGTAAPDENGAVVATREGSSTYGGYKIYRFYEGPEKVYCWAEETNKAGQEMCLFFLDLDSYIPPERLPPGLDVSWQSREACNSYKPIEQCYIDHFSDGSSVRKDLNLTTGQWKEERRDSQGNLLSTSSIDKDGNPVNHTKYDPVTGDVVASYQFHPNGMMSTASNRDPFTGKVTELIRYNEKGQVSSVTVYDPITGIRTDQYTYDPSTGKNQHLTYGPDGNSLTGNVSGVGNSGKDSGKTYCQLSPTSCHAM